MVANSRHKRLEATSDGGLFFDLSQDECSPQGQSNTAIGRLGPLTIGSLPDPYYMLAAAEVIWNEAYLTPTAVTDCWMVQQHGCNRGRLTR